MVIVDQDPTETYARLLLMRTLERQSRHDEAATQRRLLVVMTGDEDLVAPRRRTATSAL